MRQMSLWEEAPARHSASPDSGRLWTIHAASSCSNISELAQKLIRNGSSGRTCPEYCRLNADGLSSRSLKPWPNSGLMGGAAWRVLDAQFFGVAQRRERVFLVVNTRDWRRAAPVLFERESLCWDHQSSREKRKSLTGGTAGGVGNADSGIGNLTHGGNNVPLVKAFKWNQGERSRSLAIGDVSPTLSTDHNPAVYEIAGNIVGRDHMNGGHQLGVADPDENGAFTLTSTDRHAVVEIERERSDVPGGQPGERRIGLRPRADLDGACREGCADHIPIMTSNGDDVFPALCATDGSKRFIDNQSINGGRLLIDRRRT